MSFSEIKEIIYLVMAVVYFTKKMFFSDRKEK